MSGVLRKAATMYSGFAAMGKPIPFSRQQTAYDTARSCGLDQQAAYDTVAWMAEQLRRDKPYEALHGALKYGIDLTGAYRLMAVLLAA